MVAIHNSSADVRGISLKITNNWINHTPPPPSSAPILSFVESWLIKRNKRKAYGSAGQSAHIVAGSKSAFAT